MEKKVNISGIIISIIRPCACCLESVDTGVTIFCCSHIVPPTSSARKMSGRDKSIHRN